MSSQMVSGPLRECIGILTILSSTQALPDIHQLFQTCRSHVVVAFSFGGISGSSEDDRGGLEELG